MQAYSVLDPDSGAFWIRIRRIRLQWLQKRSKMLNQHKNILLFTTLTFFDDKMYNYEIIIYYF